MPDTLHSPSVNTASPAESTSCQSEFVASVSASESADRALARELNACLPLFPVLVTQLREAVDQIEQGVVQVCDSFEGMAARAREAVAQISPDEHGKAANQGCAGIEQLIDATRETMGRLLKRIEQTSELSGATVQRMLDIEQRIHGLEDTLKEIDAVAAHARLLALNGQIEAARAGKHGAAFAIVATETAKMAVHAVQSSKSIRTMIGSLSEEIADASRELRQRATADTEEAAQSRTEVTRALDCMASMHGEMQQTMVVARENSQRLARDISQAIVAMQFQDAVSQRIGHVVSTLEDLHDALQSRLSPDDARGPAGEFQDWTRRMAAQYTMASERDALALHVTIGADNTQGLGDNVELF